MNNGNDQQSDDQDEYEDEFEGDNDRPPSDDPIYDNKGGKTQIQMDSDDEDPFEDPEEEDNNRPPSDDPIWDHRNKINSEATIELEPKHYAFGGATLVFLMVILCVICVLRHMRRKEVETQKSLIFAYLQQFDVEDIDLRKSPPGGWHGTYLNELAYGVNKSARNRYTDRPSSQEQVQENVPLTHSSVVTDSLFMNTKEAPILKFEDNPQYDDDSHIRINVV
jgi:hypothetical protein